MPAMQAAKTLTIDRVICDADAASKKRVLEQLSALIASANNSLLAVEVFDSLIARERLGSTGLDHGVAIPHGRVKNCEQTVAAFIKLRHGIDFDATDNQPVDLLFALLVPENSTDEHLEFLAQLAQTFSDPGLRQRLREADTSETLLRLLQSPQP